MELRYVDFLERRGVRPRMEVCIDDLNAPGKAEEMFTRIGVRHRPLDLHANRNLSPRRSTVTDREHAEAAAFLRLIPDHLMRTLPNTYGIEGV